MALSERKQELYELSARAGSTRADAAVDVDGGNATAIVEDDPIPLGQAGHTSVVSQDQGFVRETVLRIAAHHGRVLVPPCSAAPG